MEKICSFCVMDSMDPTIKFNDTGRCNYCIEAEARASSIYFPNEEGKSKLDNLMAQMKQDCVNDKYDCLVGVSGGLDSAYVIYLGYKYGLRMKAVHIDDGLDTFDATHNIESICSKTGTDLMIVTPDREQYADLILSFLKAAVPNLAIPQDNIILGALHDETKKGRYKYFLSGANFAHEFILQRTPGVMAADNTHIKDISKKFGTIGIDRLRFATTMGIFGKNLIFTKQSTVSPLNYIDYNLNRCVRNR